MAAETPLKRQREEEAEPQQTHMKEEDASPETLEISKRHKSNYTHIISILEEEREDEPSQDLSSLITALQQELSSQSAVDPQICPSLGTDTGNVFATLEGYHCDSSSDATTSAKEEDDKERVMKHLLEASDDELGLPNPELGMEDRNGGEDLFTVNGGGEYPFGDGLWEFDDEAANYYSMLQSELFLVGTEE